MFHHCTCLPHHRITGIVVGQDEVYTRLLDKLDQLFRVLKRRCQRLVTNDVNAAFQEFTRNRKVHVVRRDDRDRLDAVLETSFPLCHREEVAVDPSGVETQIRTRCLALRGSGTEAARHQFKIVVNAAGDPVHGADKGVASSSDHAKPNPPQSGFRSSVYRHELLPVVASPAREVTAQKMRRRQYRFTSRQREHRLFARSHANSACITFRPQRRGTSAAVTSVVPGCRRIVSACCILTRPC